MKTAERDEARRLRRKEGESIKGIARVLGVAVSSVGRWVADIELTPEQLGALRARNPAFNGQRSGARTRSLRARELRRKAQEEGRIAARHADADHAAACMLFWAEGSKARNVVQLSNSDPEMVVWFLAFVRRYFGVPDEKVRIQCNLHADDETEVRRIEDFWLNRLGLSRVNLTKSIVNSVSRSSLGKRRRLLPYGTCRLTICSTPIVQHLYGAIQEYAGFEREGWLDCLPVVPDDARVA